MITAKEANYIAKYDNPQKKLVSTTVEKLIQYIEARTVNESQHGSFESALTIRQNNLSCLGLSDKLSNRSIKETIEKVANILEKYGYDIYYENDFIKWSWNLNE